MKVNWRRNSNIQGSDALRDSRRKKKNRPGPGPWRFWEGCTAKDTGRQQNPDYMWSIMTWPKPEQLTWVAPSIRRAKS